MTKPPSARIYAAIYACSERSIRNYRAAGAPLADPAAMFMWWATRKNLPKGAADKGLDAIREALAAVVGTAATPGAACAPLDADTSGTMNVPEDLPAGAEHELRWLGNLAVEARRNLIRASKSGNALTQKQALDSYIKVTESLRKYDNQVTQDRRNSDEMIARSQIESALTGVIVWTQRGVENFLNEFCLACAECDTPEHVYAIAADRLRDCLSRAVHASMDSQTHTPGWVRDAMVEGL